jgi:ABC-type nitrate/sulfonate/bicarbonate transport system ATPase subunit
MNFDIEVVDLVKVYIHQGKKIDALASVSFGVREGEALAIVGKSGGGKSTLLQIISGLLAATSGKARFRGAEISEPNRKVALMFQQSALLPWLTVIENTAYPLKIANVPLGERDERARKVLAMLGLSDHGSRYPSQLSGGQAQRVALARAIIGNPQVLLLDEPFSSVDAISRLDLYSALETAREVIKSTMILVTHDLSEALLLADRALVFGNGKIQGELDIKSSRGPRKSAEFESSHEFTKCRAQLKDMIRSHSQQ